MRTLLTALSMSLTLATLVQAEPLAPQKPLTLKHDAWSLDIREPAPVWPKKTMAPPTASTMADTIADGLADRGIGFDHSAIIVGRDLGDGWHLYAGGSIKGSNIDPAPRWHERVPMSVGFEYRLRF